MNIKKTLLTTLLGCMISLAGCSNEDLPSQISQSDNKPVTSKNIITEHSPYEAIEDSAFMFFKNFANEIPKTFVKKDNAYHDSSLKINDSNLSNSNYQGSGRVISFLDSKEIYFETLLVAQYEQKPGTEHSQLVRFFGRSRIKDEEYVEDEKAGKITDQESATFFVLYDFFRNKDIITIYSDNEAFVYFNQDMHFDKNKTGWKKAKWYNTQNNSEPLKLYPFLSPKRTRNMSSSVDDKHVGRYESLARDFIDTYYNINKVPVEGDSAQTSKDISDSSEADKQSTNDAAEYIKRGNTYYRSKQHKKAISEYNKAIVAAPKYAPAYYNRGNAYASLKMFKQAKKDLLKAAELDPSLKPNVKKSSDAYKLNLKLD